MINSVDKEKIDGILAKYKDSPLTQDTYNSIQNDLQAAGVSPQQLAQKDALVSYSSTQVLLDALSGKTTTLPSADSSDEQTKATNYMQQIYKQWQSTSTAIASDTTPTGTSSSS